MLLVLWIKLCYCRHLQILDAFKDLDRRTWQAPFSCVPALHLHYPNKSWLHDTNQNSRFMLSRQSAIRLFSKKKTNLKCTPLNTQSVIEMLCKRKGLPGLMCECVFSYLVDDNHWSEVTTWSSAGQSLSQPSNWMIHCFCPHQASIKPASHQQPAVTAPVIQKMGCLLTATSCLQRINLFQLSSDRTVTLQLLLLTLAQSSNTLDSLVSEYIVCFASPAIFIIFPRFLPQTSDKGKFVDTPPDRYCSPEQSLEHSFVLFCVERLSLACL